MGDRKKPKTWRDVMDHWPKRKKDYPVVREGILHHPQNCPGRSRGFNHHGGCEKCDTKIPIIKK